MQEQMSNSMSFKKGQTVQLTQDHLMDLKLSGIGISNLVVPKGTRGTVRFEPHRYSKYISVDWNLSSFRLQIFVPTHMVKNTDE